MNNLSLKIKYIDPEKLHKYTNNSRTHADEQITEIANSIQQFGFVNPILLDEDTGIIAGHGRLIAAQQLKLSSVPTIELSHLSDQQKSALLIADNRIAENAGWDEDILSAELTRLNTEEFDVNLLGFTESELDELLEPDEEDENFLTHEDECPDVEESTNTHLGDIYQLGDHYLMCGSSTESDQIAQLLSSGDIKQCDMTFTDPPYLMDFRGSMKGDGTKSYNSKHKAIANDKLSKSEGEEFLTAITANIKKYCRGAWYICFYRLGLDWMFDALKNNGMKYRNVIIWHKGQLTLSNSDYKSTYEPIIYGWESDYDPILYGWNEEHKFQGRKGETDTWKHPEAEGELSVWEISRTRLNDLHPTMKPIYLCERAILNSSKKGQNVLDLFGGSGSTLIACEKTGRNAYLMELEPTYCDVIIKRWEEYTGKKAVQLLHQE